MYDQIMDAVTQRLDELFEGDGYTIYTDEVAQDLREPCFFVSFLEPSEKQRIGNRYYRETGMAVQFLPGEADQPSRLLRQVAECLMGGLEYVMMPDGKPIRGTNREWKVADGVLNFFVNYNVFVQKEKGKEDAMEALLWKGESK